MFNIILFPPIEYNPKLSDATPTTRVAYVKFMATTLKKDIDESNVSIVNEKKSILRKSTVKPPSKQALKEAKEESSQEQKDEKEEVFDI